MSDIVDRMAREAGWGEVTDFVLKINPSDVESQARRVAEYCAAVMAQNARLRAENERLRGERDEAIEEAIAAVKSERETRSIKWYGDDSQAVALATCNDIIRRLEVLERKPE